MLAIRTRSECLTGIDYLPRGAATLAPLDAFVAGGLRATAALLRRSGLPLRPAVPRTKARLPVPRLGCGERHSARGALSYSEVAARIGSAPRAVGAACGANRIPLLIPCHRVVGAGGIGGFMHSRRGPPASTSSAGCCATKAWQLAWAMPSCRARSSTSFADSRLPLAGGRPVAQHAGKLSSGPAPMRSGGCSKRAAAGCSKCSTPICSTTWPTDTA